MKYCTKCLTPDTRPRITFDESGVCNACQNAENKKTFDWDKKWRRLEHLCEKYRGKTTFDVIVPCSGGKDGSYVAWKLKHELKMNPLCITFAPQLPTEIGKQNLENFKKGFDHLTISPNYEKYREIAIKGFVEQGRPKLPFVTGISTAILQFAMKFKIPFIMYGEEGEAEYGGTDDAKERIDRNYLIANYYSGKDPSGYGSWWELPDYFGWLYPTHWSKFENWDPLKHAELAKEKCGLQTEPQVGTFTDYSQLDDKLQDLHAYMMFVKFGFGRATSDANIEIRAGRMTREEGLKLVEKHDGEFPEKYMDDYLEYFNMNRKEFMKTILKHNEANK